MSENLFDDVERGIKTIETLEQAYEGNVFFNVGKLPEELLPDGMEKGSNEHLIFLTLVSSQGYLRKEELLWSSARETFEDDDLKYLFQPSEVLSQSLAKVEKDLKEYNLLLNPKLIKNEKIKFKSVDRRLLDENDLAIWINLSNIIHAHDNNIEKLFEKYDFDVEKILNAFMKPPLSECFPNYQKERKIIIWLLRIKENANFEIKNFITLRMPVNYHIIRGTFFSGSIWGNANSIETDFEGIISGFWDKVSRHPDFKLKLTPLEFEKYLWLLSKYGCSKGRHGFDCSLKNDCPIGDFCSRGMIKILNTYIAIEIEQSK